MNIGSVLNGYVNVNRNYKTGIIKKMGTETYTVPGMVNLAAYERLQEAFRGLHRVALGVPLQ